MNNLNNNFAVIFDMDGVLVNNSAAHIRAFAEFNGQGGAFHPDMFGLSNEDIFKMLFPEITSPEEVRKMADEKEAYYRKIYKDEIKAMPGLIDLLKALQQAGIKIAVGSSAPSANVNFVLDTLNIRHYFNQIVDSSGVTKCKPDPEIYLKASRLVETAPSHCIVFEDAAAGIEAAQRAGMKVIGVATTLTYDQLSHTNQRIHDFTEITVDGLRKLVG